MHNMFFFFILYVVGLVCVIGYCGELASIKSRRALADQCQQRALELSCDLDECEDPHESTRIALALALIDAQLDYWRFNHSEPYVAYLDAADGQWHTAQTGLPRV